MARQRVKGAASPLDAAPNLGNALQLDQAILGQLRGLGGAQPGGLVIADDGTVSIGSFRLTSVGISGGDEATADQLDELGRFLGRINGSLQWLLGDWACRAERVWGESYRTKAADFGFTVNTLYEYARVCRAVNFSIRIEKLSFGHHQLVAGMEPQLQAEWLQFAAEHGLSITKLRTAINPALGDDSRKDPALKRATQYAGYITNELPGLSEAGVTTAGLIEQRARFLAVFYAQVADQAATRKRQAKGGGE